MTMELARQVERSGHPELGRVRFSSDELTQLRYAALLHDFGKVGVREAVLTKARKLYPERLELLKERFAHALRAREAALLRRTLAGEGECPAPSGITDKVDLDHRIAGESSRLASMMELVFRANEPAVLQEACSHALGELAAEVFPGPDGDPVPLVHPGDLASLMVPKGSLTEDERAEVESHVVHSYRFLLTLPWPQRFRRVPEIAHLHHEQLDGRGYPNRFAADRIPLEARLIAVCDVFDALAAADRPYKRAVSCDRALAILEEHARSGALDDHLVRLFIDAEVYHNLPQDNDGANPRPFPERAG